MLVKLIVTGGEPVSLTSKGKRLSWCLLSIFLRNIAELGELLANFHKSRPIVSCTELKSQYAA